MRNIDTNLRIAGIIVTYNRLNELKKCLEALSKQTCKLSEIIVVNNASTDGTADYLIEQEKKSSLNIIHLRLEKNIGGAGGFEQGCREAVKRNNDLLWLMDDDGYPETEDTLKNLLIKARQLQDSNGLLFLNSLVLMDEQKLSFGLGEEIITLNDAIAQSSSGFIEGLVNPFNGTLISSALIKEIGYPNGNYFIKGDESDFLRRANKAGACIGTVINSKFRHPEMQYLFKQIRGRKIKIPNEASWKWYYRTRNYTYIAKKENGFFSAVRSGMTSIAKGCLGGGISLLLIRAFFDGMSGRLGSPVLPGKSGYDKSRCIID